MPLTPFIGLSVLVHLGVIAWHKISSWFPKKEPGATAVRGNPAYMQALSFAIVIVVFLAVLANAFILIRASVLDSHSSIRIVDNYVVDTLEPAPPMPAFAFDSGAALKNCVAAFGAWTSAYNGSIVQYLATKGLNFSFGARAQLAAGFGISDYRGSAEQNRALLINFFTKTDEFSSVDVSSCKIE